MLNIFRKNKPGSENSTALRQVVRRSFTTWLRKFLVEFLLPGKKPPFDGFDKLTAGRLRTSQDFQKLLEPSPDFVRRTGFLFLSVFSQKFGRDLGPASPRAFLYFLRGAASGVALMLVVSAGAAYADQKNVGPHNLLYPLKRAQEAVKLTLSNAEEKPVLHLKLAERRLEEIEDVKQKNPSSGKILGLSDDLRKELRNSVGVLNGDEFEKPEKSKSPAPQLTQRSEFPTSTATPVRPIKNDDKPSLKQIFTEKSGPSICASFRALITSQNSEVREVIGDNPKLMEKFEKKCLPVLRQSRESLESDSKQELKADDQTKHNQRGQEIQTR